MADSFMVTIILFSEMFKGGSVASAHSGGRNITPLYRSRMHEI
jgi:hypothetical protein